MSVEKISAVLRCLGRSETTATPVDLRVRAVSQFGTRVVWFGEAELPSLWLCLVTRAGEISLATRGGSERNLLLLFTLRNDRVCSNFRAFPVTRTLRCLRRIHSRIYAVIMASQDFHFLSHSH